MKRPVRPSNGTLRFRACSRVPSVTPTTCLTPFPLKCTPPTLKNTLTWEKTWKSKKKTQHKQYIYNSRSHSTHNLNSESIGPTINSLYLDLLSLSLKHFVLLLFSPCTLHVYWSTLHYYRDAWILVCVSAWAEETHVHTIQSQLEFLNLKSKWILSPTFLYLPNSSGLEERMWRNLINSLYNTADWSIYTVSWNIY